MFITGVNDTGEKLFSGVNDTGEKFIAGVADTGDKFIPGINDNCRRQEQGRHGGGELKGINRDISGRRSRPRPPMVSLEPP